MSNQDEARKLEIPHYQYDPGVQSALKFWNSFSLEDLTARFNVAEEDLPFVFGAAFAASEVSRATKELQVAIGKERDQVSALQEHVKALRDALDAAQTFAEELSDMEASENRYSHAAVATTIAVRISELLAALSQVPAQKEQDNG